MKQHTTRSSRSLSRRDFAGTAAMGSLAALFASRFTGRALAADPGKPKPYVPISERKVRMGIIGYGVCKFGAEFGFQDHPNVEIVAVSDLFPDRHEGLMQACRCPKSYESLEVLLKDPKIEAVFLATDAPSHAKHAIAALRHGKHVMTAVPAVWGSIEEAEQVVQTVRKTGLKYMMAETSCFHASCHAMRQIYRADGFGRIVYSEGEYYHHVPTRIDSYRNWRVASPPLWYPTHATAYYIGVTGKRFTSVSCVGFHGSHPDYQPGANAYNNTFRDEVALFHTSEGGMSRMTMCKSIPDLIDETGRVYGEKGWMNRMNYRGTLESLPDIARPALPPGLPEGAHGGSHGHLSHEFISAILQDREPLVNVYEALAMTVPGIVAHQSALKDGELLKVPQFERPRKA